MIETLTDDEHAARLEEAKKKLYITASDTPLQIKAKQELAKRELARRRLLYFVEKVSEDYKAGAHHKLIIEKLEGIASGKIKRLMVFMPPRHGKSLLSSIYFPAWFLGKHPKKNIIACSYGSELATTFGRQVRNLVASREYQHIHKIKLAEDSQASGRWHTDSGGSYTATGVGGSITGKGADILIIDDPIRNREDAESETIRAKTIEWYLSTAFTRLSPTGAIILVQTRWHDGDLAGYLLDKMQHEGEQWEILSLPAINEAGEALWPEQYSVEMLLNIKKVIGLTEWSSLYQQQPLLSETQEFKQAMFHPIPRYKVEEKRTNKFLSIDTAVSQRDSADDTGMCINFVDEQNFWNIKAWGEKITPLQLIDKIFALHEVHRFTRIGIEKGVYSMTIKPFLDAEMRRRNVFLPITELHHNQQQKEMRIRSLLPRYESNSIFHIQDECTQLEEQLLRFPKGIHDDVADALAYMSQLVSNKGAGSVQQFIPNHKHQSYRTIALK